MTGKRIALIAAAALALTAAGCAQEPAATAAEETNTMAMSEQPAPAATSGPIRSTGTVTAVDASAGTISLDHEPIPAISWPAMSMQFRAEDPAILQGIAAGDHVTFELKSASETSTIIMVEKQ
jgi:Cu/Ag efflux protein CusF